MIFLLKRIGKCDWDECAAMVVRASYPERARAVAASEAQCEGHDVWIDASQSTCIALADVGDDEVILQDVLSG